MRSRKPCVFARRRLFGWKVRLLTVGLHHSAQLCPRRARAGEALHAGADVRPHRSLTRVRMRVGAGQTASVTHPARRARPLLRRFRTLGGGRTSGVREENDTRPAGFGSTRRPLLSEQRSRC
jgi:hypothetical protein